MIKPTFPIKVVGEKLSLGHAVFTEKTVVAYAIPSNQILEEAWLFYLFLETGEILEFSSMPNRLANWNEVNSLKIVVSDLGSDAYPLNLGALKSEIPRLRILSVAKAQYEDDECIVDCGIVIRAEDGNEITISAGIPPGSITIRSFFSNNAFKPQFKPSECKLELI